MTFTTPDDSPHGDLPKVQLRTATLADVPALERLIPDAVRALSVGFYSPEVIEASIELVFGPDRQLIVDGTYIVAECEGRIVGAGGWSRRQTTYGGDKAKPAGASPDAVDRELDPRVDAARIRAFYVDPTFARRGIGSSLLARCEAEARAAGFTRLEIVATLPGEKLYSRHGYLPAGRIDIPLRDGLVLPSIRMVK